MKLIALDLSGFKSFANTVRFSFDEGITAVIGPNGSGKSNVAEAIRWVLGEQSLKPLRGKERTDVIFAGSNSANRKNVARVTITISNDTGRMAIDAPEVAISRTINRAGESEYLINGDPVRLFDIQHLLAAAGLGARSYAVISQGMVDQYLTAKPTDRRELFDEATGIRGLQLKLTRAVSKLKQSSLHLQELQTIVTALQPQLIILKRQVKRHAKRQELLKLHTQVQHDHFRAVWHKQQTRIQATQLTLQQASQEALGARQMRQRAETALLNSVRSMSGDENKQRLRDQLHHAEQEWQRSHLAYQEQQQETAALTTSLQQVRVSLTKAREQLQVAEAHTNEDSFISTLTTTLVNCKQILVTIRVGQPIEEATITNLIDSIEETQELIHNETAGADTAMRRWQQLEGPLQAVARLEAIDQERQEQLARLGTAAPPDKAALEKLQAQVSSGDTSTQSQQAARSGLDTAHQAEQSATQAATVAEIAYTQAEEGMATIIADIRRECGSKFLEQIGQQAPTKNSAETARELAEVTGQLGMLGEIDPLALREYEEVTARHASLQTQLSDATSARDNAQQLVISLEASITTQFTRQFQAIRESFQQHFRLLFGGGTADLEVVSIKTQTEGESEQGPMVTGVEITVHPPGKQPSHLNLLSGGEKALTSLALVLAIVHVQQPPFVILDEVDAALDEANSYRFTTMLQELRSHTQCVVITHNRETMNQADALYGITMAQDGISQVFSVKAEEVAETTIDSA